MNPVSPAVEDTTVAILREHAASLIALHPESESRIVRAIGLVVAGYARQVAHGGWKVRSECNPETVYTVVRGLSCTCPDATHRGMYCKHLAAADLATALGDTLYRQERERAVEPLALVPTAGDAYAAGYHYGLEDNTREFGRWPTALKRELSRGFFDGYETRLRRQARLAVVS